jgi:hypothetical protein
MSEPALHDQFRRRKQNLPIVELLVEDAKDLVAICEALDYLYFRPFDLSIVLLRQSCKARGVEVVNLSEVAGRHGGAERCDELVESSH